MHGTLDASQLYVTVDLILLTVREGRLNLLLSRRTNPPFAGRWALPGRFVGLHESAETAAQLLLQEMLPLPEAYTEQLFTFTQADRDPRGRVISCAYLVVAPWSRVAAALDEHGASFGCFEAALEGGALRLTAEDGRPIDGAPAFDHARIAETALRRLRGKIDYTDIGFHFLEDMDSFSLSELQTIFEAVLDAPLDDSNFRRAILARYERNGQLRQTDRIEKRRRGRPAALYRFTPADDDARRQDR